jgi:hypothetical protein
MGTDHEARLSALETRLRALLDENAALVARVAELESATRPTPLRPTTPTSGWNRRQVLVGGAVAAAGGALGVAAGPARPAGAADGDPVLAGRAVEAGSPTTISVTDPGPYGFGVLDGALGAPVPGVAVVGHAAGANLAYGLYGLGEGSASGVLAESTGDGAGLLALSAAGTAVSASGATSGVVGQTVTGTGVRGESTTGSGLVGYSRNGIGVVAVADDGWCLQLSSTKDPARIAGRPGAVRGLLDADADGTVWLCVGDAAPGAPGGVWRAVAGPTTAGALHLLPAPARVYDSRAFGSGPAATGDGRLSAGTERTVPLDLGDVGGVAVPAVSVGATAALVTVTITDTVGSGFLAVFSDGVAWPGHSTSNWTTTGQTVATTTVTAVRTSRLRLRAGGHPDGTNVLIDVIGWFG